MMGASQSALSIQNPSQSGPRTHSDEDLRTQAAAVPVLNTAAGEASSVIRATECAVTGTLKFTCYANALSLKLHGEAAAGRVDRNAFLCGRNAHYYPGLI
jgi:hypothetical protein